MGSSFDAAIAETDFRASFDCAAVGNSSGFCYLRGEAASPTSAFGAGLERLPHGCEVFECVAASVADAQRLQKELIGRGGLGGLHSITRSDATLLIEYIGDLFLLFDFIDATGIAIERRAVVPLEDASLIAVANVVWRDGTLDEQRILERAARI